MGATRTLSCFRKALLAAGLAAAAAQPAHAADGAPATMLQTALVAQASEELKGFYFHSQHPLWISDAGVISPAADKLLQLLKTAEYDGLDPQALGAFQIEAAMLEARANPTQDALVRAEALEHLATQPDAPPLVLVTHHVDDIPPSMSHVLLLRDGRPLAVGPSELWLLEPQSGVRARLLASPDSINQVR